MNNYIFILKLVLYKTYDIHFSMKILEGLFPALLKIYP